MSQKTFGEVLRQEREIKNWSREHLANMIRLRVISRNGIKCTVGANTIKQIELGMRKRGPQKETFNALATIFPILFRFVSDQMDLQNHSQSAKIA